MKVNTTQNSNLRIDFLTDIIRNRPWAIIISLVYIVLAFLTFNSPFDFSLTNLDYNFIQFSLSTFTMGLSISIGLYLLFNDYRRTWGTSFLIYSLTFLGLSLQALEFSIADMTNPLLLFLWRVPMILFIVFTWYGNISFYTNKRDNIVFSSVLIGIISIIWLIIGLGFLDNIKLTMNVFLFTVFIPIILFSSLSWYKFNQETFYRSTSILSIGYLLIGLIYTQWLPWETLNPNPGYNIFYTLLILAFILLFRGFIQLTNENRNYI